MWAVCWEEKLSQQCLDVILFVYKGSQSYFPQDSKNQAAEDSFHICSCELLSSQHLVLSATQAVLW